MLATFSVSLQTMLVLFCCMAIGYLLKKTKFLPDEAATMLSRLETHVLLPCLNVLSLMTYCTPTNLAENYMLIIYGAIAIIASMVVATLITPVFSKDKSSRGIYKYAFSVANYGFMGYAVVLELFGDRGLFLYILFTIPTSIAVYTYIVNGLIPKEKRAKNLLSRLVNPTMISIVIGIALGLTGVGKYFPPFVTTTLENLSSCMGPVAMVLAGFVIGSYPFKSLITKYKIYITTVMRLFILPLVPIAAVYICGADKYTAMLTLVAFATPIGLNTIVYPAAYGGDTYSGASMSMISHVASVISLPIMYTILDALL